MIIDSQEHKEILLQMLNTVSVPGSIAEKFVELKNAVMSAEVKKEE